MHPYTKAVVELVPFAYDSIYYRNYVSDLGFADYIVSTGKSWVIKLYVYPLPYSYPFFNVFVYVCVYVTGHLTPNAQGPVPKNKRFCAFLKYNDFDAKKCKVANVGKVGAGRVDQSWFQCPAAYHSKACDLWVNITTLASHLNGLLQNNLCSLSSSSTATK